MKLTVLYENFDETVNTLRKFGISKLSQKQKDEIDDNYRTWLKMKKKRRDTPNEFNEYLKDELGLGL